ncbi:hypothetical protein NQ318_022026 [Aromia moschata]|uniref:Cathepsin propeptide inhibitor domain-containing protein n=1 Tax=Aromia moschata TaxID=1265417 RepID=A0AAV8Z556_9CUCU|nr:hypothetical protein NQ318_022026 [Aromia moschata]
MSTQTSIEDQWTAYKSKFKKSYSDSEEPRRFEIFKEKVEIIEAHNKRYEAGEVTYKKEVNQFADLTPEELKKFTSGLRK